MVESLYILAILHQSDGDISHLFKNTHLSLAQLLPKASRRGPITIMSDVSTITIDLDKVSNLVPGLRLFHGTLFIVSTARHPRWEENFERLLKRLKKILCVMRRQADPKRRFSRIDMKPSFDVADVTLARALLETLRTLRPCRSFTIDFGPSFRAAWWAPLPIGYQHLENEASAFCRQVAPKVFPFQRLPGELQDMVLKYCVVDDATELGLDLSWDTRIQRQCCGRCGRVPDVPCSCKGRRSGAWSSGCTCTSVAKIVESLGAFEFLRKRVIEFAYRHNCFRVPCGTGGVVALADTAAGLKGLTKHVRNLTISIAYDHENPNETMMLVEEMLKVLPKYFDIGKLNLTLEIGSKRAYWDLPYDTIRTFDKFLDWLPQIAKTIEAGRATKVTPGILIEGHGSKSGEGKACDNGLRLLMLRYICKSDQLWHRISPGWRQARRMFLEKRGWRTHTASGSD